MNDNFKVLSEALGIPYEDVNEGEFTRLEKQFYTYMEKHPELFRLCASYTNYHVNRLLNSGELTQSLPENLVHIDNMQKLSPLVFGLIAGYILGKKESNTLQGDIWKW